jgi:hypothetical protein
MVKVFIGSSSEARPIAQVIAEVLRDLGALTTGWWYPSAFHAGESIIEGIERNCAEHNAAVLVATADDRTTMRGAIRMQPRDNLIYEAGYFAAKYGRGRAAIVRVGSPELPSDLGGVIYLPVKPPTGNLADYGEELRPTLRRWIESLAHREADAATNPRSDLIPYLKTAPLWRLATSDQLIERCGPGSRVRFIAVTGYGLFAREPRPAEPLRFIDALKRGVLFDGVVLDPASPQADLRGSVETPGVARHERLLEKDAENFQRWLSGGYRSRISDEQRKSLVVKRSDGLISFGLLMFEEVAFIEPLHLGKVDGIDHLCGFSIIRAPRGSHEYDVARKHFDLLFDPGIVIE